MLSNRLAGRRVTGTTSRSRFRHTPWLVLVPLLSGMVLAGTAGCAGQITGSPTVQAIPSAVSGASSDASEAATAGVTSSAATSATDTTLTGATATTTTATGTTAASTTASAAAAAPGAEQPGGDAAPQQEQQQPQQQQPQHREEQQPAEPAQPQAPADPAVGADPADRTTDAAKPGLAEQATEDADTASRTVTSTATPLATPTARQLPTPSPTQVPTGLPSGQPQITVTVQVADTCDSGSTIAPSFQIGTRNATAVAVTAIRNGQASAVDTGGFALTGFTVVQFAGTNFQCVGVDGFVNTETVQFVATGPGGSATTTVQVSVAAK